MYKNFFLPLALSGGLICASDPGFSMDTGEEEYKAASLLNPLLELDKIQQLILVSADKGYPLAKYITEQIWGIKPYSIEAKHLNTKTVIHTVPSINTALKPMDDGNYEGFELVGKHEKDNEEQVNWDLEPTRLDKNVNLDDVSKKIEAGGIYCPQGVRQTLSSYIYVKSGGELEHIECHSIKLIKNLKPVEPNWWQSIEEIEPNVRWREAESGCKWTPPSGLLKFDSDIVELYDLGLNMNISKNRKPIRMTRQEALAIMQAENRDLYFIRDTLYINQILNLDVVKATYKGLGWDSSWSVTGVNGNTHPQILRNWKAAHDEIIRKKNIAKKEEEKRKYIEEGKKPEVQAQRALEEMNKRNEELKKQNELQNKQNEELKRLKSAYQGEPLIGINCPRHFNFASYEPCGCRKYY